ncbi:alpha/beta hydrolase [Sphingomonas koreensis]|nr:alpha/beta hydrolase [Sphingomonas koreensis]
MASSALFRRALPLGARFSEWRAADGWPLRRFDLPAAGTPRGAILFQGGRGDAIEKYLELIAHWHEAGWSVTSVDWRGQGGSGRLSSDRHVGHIDTFDSYISDFKSFYADWAASTIEPRVLMGHSMGGHLVLRALVEGLARPDAAVLIAPMLGLRSPLGARWGERLAALMERLGRPERAAWKANEIPGATATRQALLTHDADRYADELWWQSAKPELLLGPPSWQWVHEAFVSTRAVRTDSRLATLTVPLLMLVAEADRLVDAKAALKIAGRLPDCQVVRFGAESAHEILREDDPVRDRAIAAIDAFLDARAPRG